MSGIPTKRILNHLGGLALLAGFVTLLTIIFSFVGAFFCAALFGLMLGTTKMARTFALFVSVICPSVLFGVLSAQKTELGGRQVLLVVALCLGTFWLLYLGAVALISCEKPAPSVPVKLSKAAVPAAMPSANSENDSPLVPAPMPELRLEELAGSWCCEICGSDGTTLKRTLEIRGDTLLVSTFGRDGRVCSRCRGRLKLVDS